MKNDTKDAPKPSPLPWKAGFEKIKDADGKDVISIGHDNACGDPACCGERSYSIDISDTDLALIVYSVNSVPRLLAANAELREALGNLLRVCPATDENEFEINQSRAALAKSDEFKGGA